MIKSKPVIGIMATSHYMQEDNPFDDTYMYCNNYVKAIVDNGGIPYFIPLVDEKIIEDSLSICDGLLLPGGGRIRPVNFEVIDYFYKKSKPILGICMGMQTLAMYSVNIENTIPKRIIKELDSSIHYPVSMCRDKKELLMHNDYVEENTILYDILGKKEIEVNSYHQFKITEVGSKFKINSMSHDGIIEGIEYNEKDKFILGVQFHPEFLPQFKNIFKVFIDKCRN